MPRFLQIAIVIALLAPATTIFAQDWTATLFPQPKHEFGTVARGAKTEHVFTFKNPLQQPIKITSVRASCGCTTPSIVTPEVAPGEVGAIRAQFNTLSFVGQRGATITVGISSPVAAEVQLHVNGYVRRDIVFNPGQIDWGTVPEGTPVSKELTIAYAGRNDWQITKASCSNPDIKLNLKETARGGGQVAYALNVELLASAADGFINDEIVFETNDQRMRSVPLSMAGNIQSMLTVSPKTLIVSNVKKGEIIKKTLFLKGNADFHITNVQSNDPAVTVEQQVSKSKVQRVPITIDTTGKTGNFTCDVLVSTDLNGISRPVKVVCEFAE